MGFAFCDTSVAVPSILMAGAFAIPQFSLQVGHSGSVLEISGFEITRLASSTRTCKTTAYKRTTSPPVQDNRKHLNCTQNKAFGSQDGTIMAPIRTALIGLSSSAATSWASGAHLPYLLSPRGRQKYTIVALCNSTVEAANRAIAAFKLSPDTKAYGDPQAVADDPDIDLVVCCTRVDVHHSTILPSVKAGKTVYVEWPLAQNVKHVAELVREAKKSGSRTIMGMQGRLAPPVVKIRETLESGRIGKVLSSEVRMFGGSNDREILPTGLKYFGDSSIGGNIYTIGYGHGKLSLNTRMWNNC